MDLSTKQTDSIGKLALALSKAQGMMENPTKNKENPFFKSKYADLSACIEAARAPLAANELALIQTTESIEKDVWIVTTLAHSSGEWIRSRLKMTPTKNDDQGRGISITYGRRYGMSAMLNIAQEDDDGNSNSKSQNEPPRNQVEESAKPNNKVAVGKMIDFIRSYLDNGSTPDDLDSWLSEQRTYISSLSPDDQKQINEYEEQVIDELTAREEKQADEPPETIQCPESGRDVTIIDCKECPVTKCDHNPKGDE